MSVRLTAVVVSTCLCTAAAAQNAAPSLTRQQRDLLKAVVTAVDRAEPSPPDDHAWLTHVLRASDGSHYVAFSIAPPAETLPDRPIVMYVRLATAGTTGATTITERSVVREWLAGSRIDPRLLPRSRGIAVGEMPAMGAVVTRDGRSSVGSADLQAMGLERERARQRKEEEERRRRAEMEGTQASASNNLPFEDFEFGPAAAFADGTRAIQRALTAGPGRFNLSVAWVDAAAKPDKAVVHVARRTLDLPTASTAGFGLSSVILADRVGVRETPYSALEQRAHPYAIGPTEITPARDAVFTRDDRISVAFQILNAGADNNGKPDVAVNFRFVRLVGERESPVATLSPLRYDGTTLPTEFDVRLGHPVIAAMSAPLASLPRGTYRLKIAASDRIAGRAGAADIDFIIAATPLSLLAEAPALGPPFRREVLLDPAILRYTIEALTPASPSPALARALTAAASGKLVDLLVEEPLPAEEHGVRATLTGLALYSIGDASATVHFQRALQLNASAGPVQIWFGAARAMQSRDPDAISAWQAALATGAAPQITSQLLLEAYLRRNDLQRASELAAATLPASPAWTRAVAASHIASQRDTEAIALLDPHLTAHTGDQEARWLWLHAAYAQFVRGGKPLPAGDAQRFTTQARAYIDSKGPNAALATDWLAQLTKDK